MCSGHIPNLVLRSEIQSSDYEELNKMYNHVIFVAVLCQMYFSIIIHKLIKKTKFRVIISLTKVTGSAMGYSLHASGVDGNRIIRRKTYDKSISCFMNF
jgi:hypothetical protein